MIKIILLTLNNKKKHDHDEHKNYKYEARFFVNVLQYYKIVQASYNIHDINQRMNCTENVINLIMRNKNMSIKHAALYKCQ